MPFLVTICYALIEFKPTFWIIHIIAITDTYIKINKAFVKLKVFIILHRVKAMSKY